MSEESGDESYAVKIMPFFVDGKETITDTHKKLSSQRINIPVPNLDREYNNLVYTGLFSNMYGKVLLEMDNGLLKTLGKVSIGMGSRLIYECPI